MDYKIISFIIMNVAFWAYVIPMCIKYGIPPSISDSYYKLRRNLQGLFTLSMWGVALPAIILGVEQSGLAFLAGVGIAFVGASPAFRSKDGSRSLESIIHRIGALTGLLGSQLMILTVSGLPIVAASLFLVCIAYLSKFRSKIISFVEVIAFLAVDLFYLLQLI